jgi:DNA-binding LytR/AlgR family response regulator
MNGVQLAREARRLRPALNVLLTSGFAGAAMQAEGVPDDLPLLGKPYRQEELAHRLRLILG